MDTCVEYANKWRITFNVNKSKCMIAGRPVLAEQPKWCLYNAEMDVVDELEILGVTLRQDGSSRSHVANRASKCRKAFYGLSGAGMKYPGISAEAKSYIWKSVCGPTLLYGTECVHNTAQSVNQLQSVQGGCLKQALGLPNRSHHSNILRALNLNLISEDIKLASARLLHRIFLEDTPARDLNVYMLNIFTKDGSYNPHTLMGRVISSGLNPYKCLQKRYYRCKDVTENGLVDTLKGLIHDENFVKPWSLEHSLVRLLVNCF